MPICRQLDEVTRKMHSITHSSLSQSWTYSNIDCDFVICQRCFWCATVLNLLKKENNNNNSKHNITTNNCPVCSSKNISIISILPIEKNDICKNNS